MKGQPGFWDLENRLRELSRQGEPAEKLSATMDLEMFRPVLDEVLGPRHAAKGGKLELTSIPADEWKTVEDEVLNFWDEITAKSPRSAKVVAILKDYVATMEKAGPPYRYG